MIKFRELPPTAGMPAKASDFFSRNQSFAAELSRFLKFPVPLLECSGTAALIVILSTLAKYSHRKNIIIPAYTCPLVALAIAHCGLQIIVCDLAPNSIDFDVNQLTNIIAKPRMKDSVLAIMPTHLGGRVSNVAALKSLVEKDRIFIIEDAAQAVGATIDNEPLGLIGDFGFYSFAIGKGLNLFEGGAIVTRHPDWRIKLQETHKTLIFPQWLMGIRRRIEFAVSCLLYRPFFLYFAYGLSFKKAVKNNHWVEAVGDDFDRHIPLHSLSAWRSKVGAKALTRLPTFIQQTREQAQRRIAQLKTIENIRVIADAENINAEGIWPFLMVIMPSETARDRALELLIYKGLGVSRLFIHTLPDYRYLQPLFNAETNTHIPNAQIMAKQMLTITNSPWLSDGEFAHIIHALNLAVNGGNKEDAVK